MDALKSVLNAPRTATSMKMIDVKNYPKIAKMQTKKESVPNASQAIL